MKLFRRFAVSSLLLLSVAACASDDQEFEQIGSAEEGIINGTAIAAENSGVVRLDTGVGMCSANLIDNNTLLTAKHCNAAAGSRATMATQSRQVDWVLDHPTLDVTIAHLSSPMTMNGSAQGYKMAIRETPLTGPETVVCRGYGSNARKIDPATGNYDQGTGAGTLREASVKVGAKLTDTILMYQNSAGQIPWHGDSGSSCFDSNGRSVGVGSSESGDPTKIVYVRADRFASWVKYSLYGKPLKHVSSGMCVHPNGGSAVPENGTSAVLWSDCTASPRLNMELTAKGSLRQASSGKCLHPEGGSANPADGTPLVFYDGCDLDRLRFEVTAGGSLRHVASGKCIHPNGGSANPADGTGLVLWSSCDEARLKFTGANL